MFSRHHFIAATVVLINLLAAGCSSKDSVIPPSDITAEQILDSAMGGTKDYRIMTTPQLAGVQPDVNVYELHDAPKPRYQMLPNPTLFIFVPAHLSGSSRMPVPAYITETKMFDKDEYALPGELYPMKDARYQTGQRVVDNLTYQD